MQRIIFLLLSLSIFFSTLIANEIQLIKKENTDSNITLLVIGGIHGDEPGGYFSASILASHYQINSRNLWVVPNLNKKSIQKNRRGIYGDMNRKFSTLKKNDRDSKIIKGIKKIILAKKVSLVLNLHDGHGFYRKKNQGNIFNPNAWGQTCVIDQCSLKQDQPFGNLNYIAKTVKENMNKKLIKEHHSFNVRNTNTKFDDEAMQLSLTYFAVTNNKPAFAIESSKNLSSLSQKVFYQLLAIEEFMHIMKIDFSRSFDLNENELSKIINNYGNVNINNNISINLASIKKSVRFIPLKYKSNDFKFSNLLGSVKKEHGKFIIYIGNKKITTLKPDYFKMSNSCIDSFDVEIDGEKQTIQNGKDFFVKNNFKIITQDDIRVNIIGFVSKKHRNEIGLKINFKNLNPWYAFDKSKKVYRVEFYKKNKFCFMSKAHFN
jgi:hypothetical protein